MLTALRRILISSSRYFAQLFRFAFRADLLTTPPAPARVALRSVRAGLLPGSGIEHDRGRLEPDGERIAPRHREDIRRDRQHSGCRNAHI